MFLLQCNNSCLYKDIAKTTTPASNNYNCTGIKPNYKWENYTNNIDRDEDDNSDGYELKKKRECVSKDAR
jgi:hypothetical protein